MALTIEQIQSNITNKSDAREIINQIADYLQANPVDSSSSPLVYKGALHYDVVLFERVIKNTLGGTFVRNSAGIYINITDTDWPGDDKIYTTPKMYPFRFPLYTGANIQGFWSLDIYEDGASKVTIQLEIYDPTGSPIELDGLGNGYFYLPIIEVYT